ncbi:MAG TPA: DUF1707 domain-containing protein [Streptosporangiaceae bacterium]|nr:DUF1707 domain-containing protein [Streptosporangiaceae bacterium]
MGSDALSTSGDGHPVADGARKDLRAADADRDRVAGILSTAYSEGRLSKDEYDARLESVLSGRTYGDLDEALTDLPPGEEPGLGQATVTPMAGNQIERTCEQRAGLARAGWLLAWAAVILVIVLIAVGLAMTSGMHGIHGMR